MGTGIGCEAIELALGLRSAAFPFCAFTALRLIGPRTGVRGTKTQPTWSTGLPPRSRPSSNSQA